MKCLGLLFAIVAGALPAVVAAQEAAPAAAAKPDLAKAQSIVSQVCAACHGADGNSAAAANPNLAGQGADYITLQLEHFKAGIRTNAVMQGMVATLTPGDMRALGVYFGQQKPKGNMAKDPTLVKLGQRCTAAGTRRQASRHAGRVTRPPASVFRRTIRDSRVSTPTTPMRNSRRSRRAREAPTRRARI